MNEEKFSNEVLRNFLLDRVDESQREQIEDSFLVDAETRELVLILEQELTEDYLEENLTSEDKERFLARYAQTAEQLQQLRIAKSLKRYAIKQAAPADVPKNSVVQQLKSRPMFLALLAVAIVVLVASVWLITRSQGNGLAAELLRLNSSAGANEIPAQTLELKPVSVRGDGAQVDVRREAGVVELRLTPLQQYPKYKARLRQVDGDEWFTIPDLQGRSDHGYFIPVRIPAYLLQRGSYKLELSSAEPDALGVDYVFTVVTAETPKKN